MATILIVDDEAGCRLPLTRLLTLEGYTVCEASDGMDALEKLEGFKPDLILLDLYMPRMDGVEFLAKIRSQKRFKGVPVFLVTAYHDVQMMRTARELGIQEYLFKGDVGFVRMLELIKKHLNEPFTRPRRGRRPKNPQPVALPGADRERSELKLNERALRWKKIFDEQFANEQDWSESETVPEQV